ncbi:MAG: orotate phosphoribosyltransferase [Planctomycetota bacterium]
MQNHEIEALLRESGAFLDGHFQLSSGNHSDRYVQCAQLLQHPVRAGLIGAALGRLFEQEQVDVVIGPALGGVLVAHEVARYLGTRALFAERQGAELVLRRGFALHPGERVLVVEDVVTSGGSALEVVRIVKQSGAEVAGVGAIIDRGGGASLPQPFRALLQVPFAHFAPDQCPLCQKGIPVVKPGSRPGAAGAADVR